ncbi:aromatic acid exporter family protein [Ornithinimicrobium sp. LYQ92]|uniref:FUSC family protein n=1 Tax=Serinicoccus sp. LYQ92 TaxID=3378798 RepID=UPI003853B305
MGQVRAVLTRVWAGRPTSVRASASRAWPVLVNLVRMTVGGVLAYLITLVVTDGPIDLTGSLTALLVMQASATGSMRMALVRVGAVVTGVGVALLVSIFVGLTWWSLAVVIFSSLLLARTFRLGNQALETPISGMLILAAAGQEIAAEVRLTTTLVGAVIGIALPLLWPPAIPVPSASGAVRRVAAGLAAAFRDASVQVDERPVTRDSVEGHLDAVRAVTGDIGRASDEVSRVRDIWRWNTRAIGRADVGPLLQTGLESLQACAAAARALFIAMLREAPEEASADAFSDDVRSAYAVVLADLGECIDAFGRLVEAETQGEQAQLHEVLDENIELLRETRAILTELMLAEVDDTEQWLLRGSILRAVDEILQVLDARTRARNHDRWRSTQGDRPLPGATTASELVPLDRVLRWPGVARWPGRRRATGQVTPPPAPGPAPRG